MGKISETQKGMVWEKNLLPSWKKKTKTTNGITLLIYTAAISDIPVTWWMNVKTHNLNSDCNQGLKCSQTTNVFSQNNNI